MPERRQLIGAMDLSGGLNLDAAPDHVGINELLRADNVVLSERGGLLSRPGTQRLNVSGFGQPVTQMLEWPEEDALLVVVGQALQSVNESNYSLDHIQDLAGDEIGWTIFQNHLYFVDGEQYRSLDEQGEVFQIVPELEDVSRCRFLVRHPSSFRFFAAGDEEHPSALYYSEPNQPEDFEPTSVLVPVGDLGPIEGLFLFGDALLVWYRHGLWMWRGIDPDLDATWEQVAAPDGIVSNKTLALTPQSLVALGEGGLNRMSPALLGMTAEIEPGRDAFINMARNRVQRGILDRITQQEQTVGVYDGHHEWYLLGYTEEPSGPNDSILLFDLSMGGAVTRWTGLQPHSFLYRRNGDLLVGEDGFLTRLDPGSVADSGQSFEVAVDSPHYNPMHFRSKRYEYLHVGWQMDDLDTEVVCEVVIEGDVVRTFELHDSITELLHSFGMIDSRRHIKKNGRRIQLRFRVNRAQRTLLYAWGIEWTPLSNLGDET